MTGKQLADALRVFADALENAECTCDCKAETKENENNEEKKTAKKPSKTDTKKKTAKKETSDDDNYSSMTSQQLYKVCCEKGISGKLPDRKKDTLIAALRGELKLEEPEVDTEDDWEETEEETDPYAGKKAKELYDMCQERGIKVKPRQTAETYAKLLKKDDEANADSDDDSDDEDWEI